jgi:S1-C subfamily serine protease
MLRSILLACVVVFPVCSHAQQREKVAKTEAALVVDGVVRQVFRSPRTNRTDYLVQIEVSRSEARKRLAGAAKVTMPVPGDSVYVHLYQLNSSVQPVASLDSYSAMPAERAQIRAYLVPRESGGWEGTFPDWYELTSEQSADVSKLDPAPSLPDTGTAGKSLGMTSELFKISNRQGLKVTSVERGGPAQKAGLEVGDVIVGVNGVPVTGQEQLDSLSRTKPVLSLHVVDVNSGRVAQIELKVEAVAGNAPTTPTSPLNPAPSEPSAPTRSLGLAAEPVTISQRTAMKITRVEPNSPAAKAGLEVNDVIVEANGQAVTGTEQLSSAVRKSGSTLTLTVRDSRTGRNTPVEVALGATKAELPLPGGPLDNDPGMKKSSKLGAVTELAFYNIEAAVRITEIEQGSPAERAGLRVGTLILEANGKSVLHPNTLNEVVRSSGPTLKLKIVEPNSTTPSTINVAL